MTTTAHPDPYLDGLSQSIAEEKESLRIQEAEKARIEVYLQATAYPEGSLGWIKGMLDYIRSHPGCGYCGQEVTAFELVSGWESPTWEELLRMEAGDLSEAMSALTEGILEIDDLLENGGDDSRTCSYCQHVLAKD